MKAPSPLLGFNNNFKHKGQVYHIQTEDSGIKHPHVITHLFADGGRILKSVKTSYAAIVGDPGMADLVREMMKEQHKAMIVALREGQFEPGGAKEVKLPTSGPFAHVTQGSGTSGTSGPQTVVEPVAAVLPPAAPPPSLPEIDVAALESAAAAVSRESPFLRQEDDLPPPPASVLGPRPQGGYQSVAPQQRKSWPAASAARVTPAATPAAQPKPSRPPSNPQSNAQRNPSRPPAGRYAMTRPASVFATSKPQRGSLFGEDLISERSLDEVILSYLAEDLDGAEKK